MDICKRFPIIKEIIVIGQALLFMGRCKYKGKEEDFKIIQTNSKWILEILGRPIVAYDNGDISGNFVLVLDNLTQGKKVKRNKLAKKIYHRYCINIMLNPK